MGQQLADIYSATKSFGLPNAMGARRPIPSELKLDQWERVVNWFGWRSSTVWLSDIGVPAWIRGPCKWRKECKKSCICSIISSTGREVHWEGNHSRGCYRAHEKDPFDSWAHCSPLMTREKGDTIDRRVIIDMTYPSKCSINAYIQKNTVMGTQRPHCSL